MRLFVGNFDFETRLAGGAAGGSATLPAKIARLNAEMAPLWLAVADEGDAIWCPEPIAEPFWSSLADAGLPRVHPVTRLEEVSAAARLYPWGWNSDVAAWGARAGLTIDAPPLEVVRAANSRKYSAEWESRLGRALPGAATCTSLIDLQHRLIDLRGERWVLKSEFSHAARERILGDGETLTPEAAAWAGKRFARDGALFLEPWVERVAEVGIQWTIDAAQPGSPILEGVTELLTHPDGRYFGSRFAGMTRENESWIGEATEATRRIAVELGERGYYGPLGIDAMLYRRHGKLAVRPVQDINARWTMGRLSLGWKRLLGPHSAGAWFHGEIPEPFRGQHAGLQPDRVWPLAPPLVGATPPVHCTTVWIGAGNL